jgi:hypothetical protein
MLLGKRFADVFLPRQGHAAEVPESMLVRSALTVSNWSMFRCRTFSIDSPDGR